MKENGTRKIYKIMVTQSKNIQGAMYCSVLLSETAKFLIILILIHCHVTNDIVLVICLHNHYFIFFVCAQGVIFMAWCFD